MSPGGRPAEESPERDAPRTRPLEPTRPIIVASTRGGQASKAWAVHVPPVRAVRDPASAGPPACASGSTAPAPKRRTALEVPSEEGLRAPFQENPTVALLSHPRNGQYHRRSGA